MSLSRSVKRWIISIIFIVLALILYRFRWGILGFVDIMPPPEACDNIKALNAYLNAGGNPSAYVGRTPLIMCATERESYDIVSRLIDLGVDVDAQKKYPYLPIVMDPSTGTTALHVSVRGGDFEITKLLFENGADINWEGSSSISPLNLSILYSRPEFLRLFLEADDIDHELDKGQIVSAAYDGYVEIFRVLFETDICLDRTYEIALTGAARKGYIEVVNFLYEQGLSIDAKDSQTGRTALHYTSEFNHINLVELLVSVRADINAMDEEGNTPLHYATKLNRPRIVKILVESGADIDLENQAGETPLDIAIKNNSLEVVTILKNKDASM